MNLKEKRVLIFSTAYLPLIGGAELAIKEITNRIKDIKFDLITAKIRKNLPNFERIGNVDVFRVGIGNENLDKASLPLLGLAKAINLNRKNKYTAIHGLMASHGSAAAYLFKHFNPKIPFILTLQEGDLNRNSRFDRFWQKRIIESADIITTISRYLFDFGKQFNKKASFRVIPNGVDLEKFSIDLSYGQATSLRDELGIKPDERVIITVSRLVSKNNVENLLKAFSHIPNSSRIKLLIIGSGELEDNLKELADELGVITRVIFKGEVPHHDLSKYLKISDVFCRPSLSEGLGTAFLEAMAAGTPVVATSVGGIRDFLKDHSAVPTGAVRTNSEQTNGLFAKADNPEDIAEKIKILLDNKELKEKIVNNARSVVERKYSWQKIAKKMRMVYISNEAKTQ